MEIEELRVMTGPNMWTETHQIIALKPSFQKLDEKDIRWFMDSASAEIPGISLGFIIKDPFLWYCAYVAQLAVVLQGDRNLLNKAEKIGIKGYFAVYGYTVEEAGRRAGELAIEMTHLWIKGRRLRMSSFQEEVQELIYKYGNGPSTNAIVEAALKKNIPVGRINGKFISLGYGCYQKRIEASICETTSSISVELAGDKATTKELLKNALLPVARGVTVKSENELHEVALELGYPLLTKPLDAHQGQGITGNITDLDALIGGFKMAREFSEEVIVERNLTGNDYRLLVIGYKLVAAAQRVPAHVVGDGYATIEELINKVNNDPRRGEGHENIQTKITIDEHTLNVLKSKDLSLDSVLSEGEVCYLKQTANLSTGGTAIDVTDEVHPENIAIAERAAKIIGLNICGIDIMAKNLKEPITATGGAILEVNAAPGLRMHFAPSVGKSRDVGKAIVELMFPGEAKSRIPIAAITGTNGKTTTTRLLAHFAGLHGHHVGLTCTDGIYINGLLLAKGDSAGYKSGQVILRDPTIDFAVLECARGGIIRSGLPFDQCDIGIVTNVAEDHLGLKDIDTLDDLVRVKRVVPESVNKNGYAVLNADDERVYGMLSRLTCKAALYSLEADNPRILAHVNSGGVVGIMDKNERLLIQHNTTIIELGKVSAIPSALEGKALFMIQNILAASLGAYLIGLPVDVIKEGLLSFDLSSEKTPGRLNRVDVNGVQVIVDYAHNPHAMNAIGKWLSAAGKKVTGIITAVGDRQESDIIEIGRIAVRIFDKIIIRMDVDTRGRDPEQMKELLVKGMQQEKPGMTYEFIPDAKSALKYAIENAGEGEIVFISVEDVWEMNDYLDRLRNTYITHALK